MSIAIVSYKHQEVNDLAWIFSAPMIVADLDLQRYWVTDVASQLNQLDRFPAPLLASLGECKSHFLGAYFEVLFSFAIRQFSSLEVIFEHQQIMNPNGTTLGEIDMLVRTPEGYVLQFEIALKYFLEVEQGQKKEWIGPNKTDSLSKKTHKARTKQLAILDTPSGQALLHQLDIKQKVKPVLLIFGYLFDQWRSFSMDQGTENSQYYEDMDARSKVYWLNMAQFKATYFDSYVFCELDKAKWVSYKLIQPSDILAFDEVRLSLEESFKMDVRPKMFFAWERVEQKTLESRDVSENRMIMPESPLRVFVVPNGW
ncbi:DUF1853 family protein [Marinomonas sp. 15G1-11]|uniref:DUF1853 family protein n=1 Tax=Marinomonas phaeophyticola TaxID=3004091 RepID=A0ABT4JWQ9_9GAMM|nr:DUF1853 family protein [Marinomonas sp. 15G1-11]MCZ2722826.1 DUF1853 family protein [Marinomonas sp. 15G1-11]